MKIKMLVIAGLMCAVLMGGSYTQAALSYDQNVTPDVIFGNGNVNGAFTVGTGLADAGGTYERTVEIGLRGKLRFDENGQPQNTFNSNGDGTYTFQAGVAPTKSSPTAVWSFEWSINTASALQANVNNSTTLDGLTYELGIDYDPGAGTQFVLFDPINDLYDYWDHSIGNNGTGNGAGVEAADAAAYAALLGENNVAQNSWQPHWFDSLNTFDAFDPTATGTYDIFLRAIDTGVEVARSDIQIMVVPEPASIAMIGLVSGCAVFIRRRFMI